MIIEKNEDGTEDVFFSTFSYKVDEIIELLEKYRGKVFVSGALEDPCLLVTDEYIQFEEYTYFDKPRIGR